jgi:hypothetical protein
VVVCPVSFSHQVESSVAQDLEAFMAAAEYFAGGCAFSDFQSIRGHQLTAAFLAQQGNARFDPFRLPAEDVMHQNPHRWLPIPNLSVQWQMSPEQKAHLRSVRQQGYDEMTAVFQHWKSMPNRQIAEWKEEEVRSGRLSDGQLLLNSLPNLVTLRHHDPQALCEAAVEFIQSATFVEVAFISVSSGLFATAARKAKNQREPPNRGFLRDVETIACLLPYCHAIVVDDTCRAYLNELRSTRRLVFDTRIFSKANMDDLIDFIEQLDGDVAPEISRLAEDVYGLN